MALAASAQAITMAGSRKNYMYSRKDTSVVMWLELPVLYNH